MIRAVSSLCLPVCAVAAWALLYSWARFWLRDPTHLTSVLAWLGPAAWAAAALATLAGLALCHAEIRQLGGGLLKRGWRLIALAALLALAARLASIPATERVYYDEHTYLQIARAIADEGRAQVAACGTFQGDRLKCDVGSYPHWSAGWPTLLAGALRLSGYARWSGHALNLALSLLTTGIIALIACSLFPKTRVWLAAAMVFLCLPANQIWSRTSAPEALGVFTFSLAALAAIVFARKPSARSGFLLAASVVMAAMVRNEAIIVVPVCALFILSIGGRAVLRRAMWPLAAAAASLLPQAAHLGVVSRGYEPWMAGAGFGAGNVPANIASVSGYFRHEPAALFCLLLAALGASKSGSRRGVALWGWTLAAFAVPMFYIAGSYAYPGGERFVLAWAAPLALLAGVGLYAVHRTVKERIPRGAVVVTWAIVFLGALFSAGPHSALHDAETAVPRRDCAFLREIVRRVPANGVVITADPPAVIAEGRSAALITWVGEDKCRLDELGARFPGGVFYFAAPSSSPNQWAGGEQSRRLIFQRSAARLVERREVPAGRQESYVLLPKSKGQ
ncbi:MAG: glycosyltransferase family 39 protein [Armatimonadota bacterium]|nr:glycosyltransferase family 39 protein [Armatimonadota bacterium]